MPWQNERHCCRRFHSSQKTWKRKKCDYDFAHEKHGYFHSHTRIFRKDGQLLRFIFPYYFIWDSGVFWDLIYIDFNQLFSPWLSRKKQGSVFLGRTEHSGLCRFNCSSLIFCLNWVLIQKGIFRYYNTIFIERAFVNLNSQNCSWRNSNYYVWSDPRRQASAAKETQKQGLRAITSRAGKISPF